MSLKYQQQTTTRGGREKCRTDDARRGCKTERTGGKRGAHCAQRDRKEAAGWKRRANYARRGEKRGGRRGRVGRRAHNSA